MKMRSHLTSLLVVAFAATVVQAQTQNPANDSAIRPRTVSALAPQAPQTQKQTPAQTPDTNSERQPKTGVEAAAPDGAASAAGVVETEQQKTGLVVSHITPQQTQARITEAERLLKSRPLHTAMTSPSIEFVTLAALEPATSRIHLITLTKQTFLTKGAELSLSSSHGTLVDIRVLRANGVNTAVTIFDAAGHSLTPLVVEFPIEKGGVFREMAYYTSAHPALLSSDLVKAGQAYVRNMLDLAAKRLREKGAFISPNIIDIAERLCLVEHVDHGRFRLEDRGALYNEIYSLYALNELDTYRYSVSTAGAGGMVQMIPWAYNMIRQRHPGVGLIPDFVLGMRNHSNALQAMLLYIQGTWNDLALSEDVLYALNSKQATQTELLAAGYNSNAAKLPLYLRRGGSSWRTLIPRETQMYLQIYKNLDSLVPMKPRMRVDMPAASPPSSTLQ